MPYVTRRIWPQPTLTAVSVPGNASMSIQYVPQDVNMTGTRIDALFQMWMRMVRGELRGRHHSVGLRGHLNQERQHAVLAVLWVHADDVHLQLQLGGEHPVHRQQHLPDLLPGELQHATG